MLAHDLTPGRATTSGIVVALAVALMALFAPSVLLILFAAILMATLLHGGSAWFSRLTGLPHVVGLGLFTILILAGFATLILVAAPVLTEQATELWRQLPRALQALRTRIEAQSWGPAVLGQISMEGLANASSGGAIAGGATSALTGAFGALGNFAIICVIGLFLAADPAIYRDGIVTLFPPARRKRARSVLNQLGGTLRSWMVAQLLSMGVIGLLTTAGLWLLGVPLAVVLGVIAALLTFIPNLGPILAAAPAVLLGFASSPIQGAYVAALYVGVQVIEGNVTTPLIQQHTIALPPALILAAQLLMASLFGLLGLALATPLLAVVVKMVDLLYVEGYLEAPPLETALHPDPAPTTASGA